MICEKCKKEKKDFVRYNSELICSDCQKKLWHKIRMKKLRKEVLDRDNHTCQMCFGAEVIEYMMPGYDKYSLEINHIIPVSKGGKDELNNLQTLCFFCHRMKVHGSKK